MIGDIPATPIAVTLARAGQLCGELAGEESAIRERGQHPRWTQMSLAHGKVLAEVVRDLAAYVEQHEHL